MKKKWIIFFMLGLATTVWLPYQFKKYQREKFFAEYLLIRESGAYTLLGTKPITDLTLRHTKSDGTQPTCTKMETPSNLQFTKSNHFDKDPYDLWNFWKRRRPVNSSRFCLVPIEAKSSLTLFLVNKNSVQAILQDYYSQISEYIGEDFDIDDIISKIDQPNSYFWTKIFNHYLINGIFYGYGFDNAKKFKTETSNAKFSNPIADVINARFKKHVSLADLPLPMFKSFSDPDPMIEKYKKEREQLQQNYGNTDLRKSLVESFSH